MKRGQIGPGANCFPGFASVVGGLLGKKGHGMNLETSEACRARVGSWYKGGNLKSDSVKGKHGALFH